MQNPWTDPDADKRTSLALEALDEALPLQTQYTRAYNAYYANAIAGDCDSALSFLGESGELVKTSVNELRTVSRQFISLITKQKLAFESVVLQTDGQALSDARLADCLADYVVDSQNLDSKSDRMAEQAYLYGLGVMGCLWRADLGPDYVADGQRILKQGDIEVFNLDLEDVRFLPWQCEEDEIEAVVFRRRRNRYALINLYPDLENEIEACGGVSDKEDESDNRISVIYLVVKDTAACPSGRLTVFLEESPNTILADGPNPYKEFPIVLMAPESLQTPCVYGYPKILDLLPVQENLDAVVSAITTNLSAFGVQAILAPEQMGLSVKDIAGLNFITYNSAAAGGGKIEPLQLTANPPDSYKYVEMCIQSLTQLSGLNQAVRGNPPPGVTAAIAISTLSANALEFLQTFSKSYNRAVEELVLLAVRCYATFARTERQIPVKPSANETTFKTFVGSQLENVRSLRLKITNPLAQTIAGRVGIAEQLLSQGKASAGEYLQLLNTGSLEAVTDDGADEQDFINKENDALRRGEIVRALSLDNHANHIRQHKGLLNDPETRRLAAAFNPQNPMQDASVENAYRLVEAVTNHILEHDNLMKSTDSQLQAVANGLPAPQQQPQQ